MTIKSTLMEAFLTGDLEVLTAIRVAQSGQMRASDARMLNDLIDQLEEDMENVEDMMAELDGIDDEEYPDCEYPYGLEGFADDEDGATAVEYAVMLSLIVIGCITTLTVLASNLRDTFQSIANMF